MFTPTEIYNKLVENPELTYADILCFILLLDNSEIHNKNGNRHIIYPTTQAGFFKQFEISKPTIARAFKKLTTLGYIKQNGLNISLYPDGNSPTKGTINTSRGRPVKLKSEPSDFVF